MAATVNESTAVQRSTSTTLLCHSTPQASGSESEHDERDRDAYASHSESAQYDARVRVRTFPSRVPATVEAFELVVGGMQ